MSGFRWRMAAAQMFSAGFACWFAAVGAAPAGGADATVPAAFGDDVATDVPDDVGLGERLALVQWLNDHQAPPKDPEDLAALRHDYNRLAHPDRIAAAATAAAAAVATTAGPTRDAAPAVSQHRQNLLDQLRKQGVTPDANLADDQLQKLLDGLAATQAEDEQRAQKEADEAAARKRAEDEAAAEQVQQERQAASEAAAARAEEVARLKAEAAKPGTHVDTAPTQPVSQQPPPAPYEPPPQSQPQQQPTYGVDTSSSSYQAGQAVGRFLVYFIILAIILRVVIRRSGGSAPGGW